MLRLTDKTRTRADSRRTASRSAACAALRADEDEQCDTIPCDERPATLSEGESANDAQPSTTEGASNRVHSGREVSSAEASGSGRTLQLGLLGIVGAAAAAGPGGLLG